MRHNFIKDGSIHWGQNSGLEPRDDFDINARHETIYEWVRTIRGAVIAGVGEVERNLDLALTRYFLGRDASDVERVENFAKFVLDNLSFERKCQASLKVFGPFSSESDFGSLRGDLNECRLTRNALAHRPFWLELVIDENQKISDLCPFITMGGETLPLTSEFTEKLNDLIRRTIELSARIARQSERSDD